MVFFTSQVGKPINSIICNNYFTVQSDLVQRTFRKMDNHDTWDKHKITDGFPIENCILGASEMRTFRDADLPRCGPSEFRTTDRTEFPLLLHHTKSASLNGHSLTHIKIYYSSDNFNESTSSISGPQTW